MNQIIDHDTGQIVSDDHALVPLSEVETFLAARPPVENAKELRDRLAALCTYYKGKVEVYNELYEGQLRTERYIGRALAEKPPAPTGWTAKNQSSPNTMLGQDRAPTYKELGFSDMQSSRLQQLASVPEEKFNSYIAARKDAAKHIVKADLLDPKPMPQAMRVLTSEETPEWYTPPGIIERARAVLGAIDLDPASADVAQQWIQAETHYTAETLDQQPWSGRVWLNPPFDDTPAWVDELEQAYGAGNVTEAVLLVNSAPGYNWWEELWRRRPVCMLRERLSFYRADGTAGGQAKKGTTIAYYGQNVARFIDQFRDLGRIILPD